MKGIFVGMMVVTAALLSGCDSDGSDSVETVFVVANNVPVAFDATFNAVVNTAFSASIVGTDPDGDPITFTVVTNVSNGLLVLEAPPGCGDMNDCGFTYTPNAGFTGQDTFTFRVNDGTADSNLATVTINVNPVAQPNSPPDVNDQFFETTQDEPISNVLVATDPDGDPLTFTLLTTPTNGTITSFNADGSFTYRPDIDYVGDDQFDFQVDDGNGGTSTATAFITIRDECPTGQNPSDGRCGPTKFPVADADGRMGADQPAITVDTLLRVNVAFVENNVAAGGTTQDLYVSRVSPTTVEPLLGSGNDGVISGGGLANRPDIISSLVTPTTTAVAWDEGNNIFTARRDDVILSTFALFSGSPNGGTPGIDPELTQSAITGSPLVVWTSLDATNDVLLASNTGFSIAIPGVWQPLDAPLDVTAANEANLPSVASDDIPGGGTNVVGRTTVAWNELDGGVSQVFVKQCPNAGDGVAANCPQLGPALNENPAVDAIMPSVTVPNSVAEALTGGSPLDPRSVVAFIEGGSLFVKRYDPGTNTWVLLADIANANGSLNVRGDLGSVASTPAIVADVLGRYSVVWFETYTESVSGVAIPRSHIYAKRFDTAGVWNQLGSILNCDPDNLARDPDIAVDTLGIPYVTFVEQEGADTRIPVIAFAN